jgi:S-ribosylhomocysteine lyase
MIRTFRFISEYEGEVPGANEKDCGNYLLHNLPMAKLEAKRYLDEVLLSFKKENMEYPS